MLPLHANAQETSASFAGGSVKLGDDNRACSGALEGAVRYTAATNIVEFCDGTSWASPAAPTPCTIGAAVGDGICAGQWQGQNLIAAPAGCNTGDTTAGDCDGTDDTATWGFNSWGDLDNSTDDMVQANADYFTECAGGCTGKAADNCAGLALDSATWYLPTIGQLAVMWDNRNTGSWTGGGFAADDYWSVTIRYANSAQVVKFSTGEIYSSNSDFTSESFRCVRLD